jgi:hypothetical protein
VEGAFGRVVMLRGEEGDEPLALTAETTRLNKLPAEKPVKLAEELVSVAGIAGSSFIV